VALDIRWLAVFADVPVGWLDRSLAYWSAVTGAAPGEPTGERGQYVALVPTDSDPYVYLQAVGRDFGGWHLDLFVPDVGWAVDEAQACGAQLVRRGAELSVLHSPAGQPFCLFHDEGPARHRPGPPSWPGIGRSFADQLCLDIPTEHYAQECAFWSRLTGWRCPPGSADEFSRINPPAALPVQLLLQRLGADDEGGARAHLDMSADSPDDEVARHVQLGATLHAEFPHWTVLRDPAGLTYCVTRRRPYEPRR
jgi:hypothetical protein